MLPKWHFLLGLIFSSILVYLYKFSIFGGMIILASSILIDLDHYLVYLIRYKDFSVSRAYNWHKSLDSEHKPFMHLFHSVEFILLIGALSFLSDTFLLIFLGLLFHSFLDIIDICFKKKIKGWGREFFLIRYLLTKDKSKYF